MTRRTLHRVPPGTAALLALAMMPTALSAQQGRIAYERVVQYDFEVPERWADQVPTGDLTELVLLFDASASVMRPAAPAAGDRASEGDGRGERIAARLRRRSASRSDQETLVESWVRFEDGATAETRELMGRTFLVSGERPAYRWQLSGEQRAYLGYTVQKATTVHDGASIEAWFTPQIPVPAGPGPYGGLPGMILVVSVDEGRTTYAATEVDLGGLGGAAIAAPADGDAVSREEYERMVAEKLDEVRTLRGGERRPPF